MKTPIAIAEELTTSRAFRRGIVVGFFAASCLALEGRWARAAEMGQSEISLTLPAGCCGIANNLNRGTNGLTEVLPVVPEGSVLYRFAGPLGWQANTYEFGAWSSPDWTMVPGEGFVLCNASGNGIFITFVGEERAPATRNRLASGNYLMGGPTAVTNTVADLFGFTPMEGDQIILPDCTSDWVVGASEPPAITGPAYRYQSGTWMPEEPRIPPGRAVWVTLASPPSCPDAVTVEIPAHGICPIANNYIRGENLIREVLPAVPEGTVVYKFVQASGWTLNTFEFGEWSNGSMKLGQGEGFYLSNPTANPLPVVLTGAPSVHPPPPIPERLPSGVYVVGSRSACTNSFNEFMGFAPVEGDELGILDCPSTASPPVSPAVTHRFSGGTWVPAEPFLAPGQAAWVRLATPLTKITLTLSAGGCDWIANPLLSGDNTVAEVIPTADEGTRLVRYEAATGWMTNTFQSGSWTFPNWSLKNDGWLLWWPDPLPPDPISPDSGFLVFSGVAPIHPPPPRPRPDPGNYVMGCRSASSNTVAELFGFAPVEGDSVRFPDCAYEILPNMPPTTGPLYEFRGGAWMPEAPTVSPGRAVWVTLVSPFSPLCPESVTVVIPGPETCVLANNYIKGNNTIAEVLPSVAEGTIVWRYLSGQGFVQNVFEFGAWTNPGWSVPPAEPLWIQSLVAQSITFSGTSPVHPPPMRLERLPAGDYVVAGRSACTNDWEQLMGFTPIEGDEFGVLGCTDGPPQWPPLGERARFTGGTWLPSPPSLNPGQAAFVHLAAVVPLTPAVGPMCETWEDPSHTNGWYHFTAVSQRQAVEWRAEGGVDGTPFVFCDLRSMVGWDKTTNSHYPLYTFGWTNSDPGAHPVSFLATPTLTLSIHSEPLGASVPPNLQERADLKDGQIRLFVGDWRAQDDYVFYIYQGEAFTFGDGGWLRSSVTADLDASKWIRYAPASPANPLPTIETVLGNPQQWGLTIVGATDTPTGWLGFDDLRLARRFESESWDDPSSTHGWQAGEQTLGWSSTNGVNNSGYAYAVLDELPAQASGQYPLWTFGCRENAPLNPIRLDVPRIVRLHLTGVAQTNGAPAPPADLQGGELFFFVGRWNSPTNRAFYRYAVTNFRAGPEGWLSNSITISPESNRWVHYWPPLDATQSPAVPLAEVLADPQQWGVYLSGATNPPTGVLGFDSLQILTRTQKTWIVGPGVDADFHNLQPAVIDDRVLSGDIIVVQRGLAPYEGQVNTRARANETKVNLPREAKRLSFRGDTSGDALPILSFRRTLPEAAANFHVWLEQGGELSGLVLQGPGEAEESISGVGFAARTLVANCTITNYSGVGCAAFCAANAYDEPSGVHNNLIAYNRVGVSNGDVEHIHTGNTVMANEIGFELVSGNSAQVINNLIVSNYLGVVARAHAEAWASYPEIANNTFYTNHIGVYMDWAPGASPMSAIVRDNIFAHQTGPAIDANTIYGRVDCSVLGEMKALQGGNYVQIRNNVFYHNNGATNVTDPLYPLANFWYAIVTDPESGSTRYVTTVPNPGGDPTELGGRMIQCQFTDPRFANDPPWSGEHPWTVMATTNSPCINRGSQWLTFGYVTIDPSPEPEGSPRWDRGIVDTGFHQDRSIAVTLEIARHEDGALSVSLRDPPKNRPASELYLAREIVGDSLLQSMFTPEGEAQIIHVFDPAKPPDQQDKLTLPPSTVRMRDKVYIWVRGWGN